MSWSWHYNVKTEQQKNMSDSRNVLVVCVVLFGSVGLALSESVPRRPRSAEAQKPIVPQRDVNARVLPQVEWTSEDEAAYVYWSQFGGDHVTTLPVSDWLEILVTESNPVLWEGKLGDGQLTTIVWDASLASVTVYRNGDEVPTAMMDHPSGRPTYRAIDSDLSGFVDVDEATGLIVLQVELAGTYHRMHASVSGLGGVADHEVAAAPSTCVCFGLGTATKSCSDQNCTDGVKCGSDRACRWKSGSAV